MVQMKRLGLVGFFVLLCFEIGAWARVLAPTTRVTGRMLKGGMERRQTVFTSKAAPSSTRRTWYDCDQGHNVFVCNNLDYCQFSKQFFGCCVKSPCAVYTRCINSADTQFCGNDQLCQRCNDSTYKYCASDINTVMNITGFHCASTSKVQLHTFTFNTGQTPVVVFESTTVTVYKTQTTINPAASTGPSISNSAPTPTAPSQSGPVPAPHLHSPSEAPAPPGPSTNTHPPVSPSAGTIAGISIGGVAALSVLAAFLWYRYRVTDGWPWSARKGGSTPAAQVEKPLPSPPPAYPEEKSGVVELPGQKLAHEMGEGGAVARVSELPVGAEKVNAGGEVYELDGGAVEGGEEATVAKDGEDVKEGEKVAEEEVEVKKKSD